MATKKKKATPANGFIRMYKNGESIDVSPLVVDDHKRLGWKTAEETAAEGTPESVEEDAEGDE